MNTETWGLVDLLFKHKSKQQVAILGANENGDWYYTGQSITPDDPGVFSSKRPPRSRQVVKLSGASKLLDHLFFEYDTAIYYAKDYSSAYAEFNVDGNVYHAIIGISDATFAEENVNCRFHKLAAFLGQAILKEAVPEIPSAGMGFNDALAFTDNFYYWGIEVFPSLDVTLGNASVLSQVQSAFRSGLFSKDRKVGNYASEYETIVSADEKDEPSFDEDPAWKEIKTGKFILDYEWDEEQKECITPLFFLDGYVPDKNFFTVFRKMKKRLNSALDRIKNGDVSPKKNDSINIILAGRPGTGKTYMLFALSAAFGIPIRSIPLGKNTEEDTFTGMSKVVDGVLTEVNTPFLQNAATGGISVIEEINLAEPDVVMGAIGQYVEFPYTIMEQGYKPISRHPLNIVCGTMNVGTAGSKEMSEALSSRFPSTYILDDPARKDFVKRLVVEGYAKEACEWVYDIYVEILETLKSPDHNCEDYALNITFRSCLGALQEMEDGSDAKSAIRNTMIGKIAEKDLEMAEQIWQEVVETKPDVIFDL